MKLVLGLVVASLGLNALLVQGQSVSSNRFQFRAPHTIRYRLTDDAQQRAASPAARPEWVTARIEGNSTNRVELGRRVVLQLKSPGDLGKLTEGRPLELSRTIRSNIFILQCPDALTAVTEANRLAALPEVEACYPVIRRYDTQLGPYAERSNDFFAVPYFFTSIGGTRVDSQWHIENRDGDSTRLGLDLNVMAAWPYTFGEGVTVAVADSGLEMNHPDLVNRLAGAPHYNFVTDSTNNPGPIGGDYPSATAALWAHGTFVAGLLAAERNNGRGVTGVAPKASLASWLIFQTNGATVSDERLMEVYEHASEVVAVQNHSWGAGNGLIQQDGPTLLEQVGIENAITFGRSGRGVVMVRSAGNDRTNAASANDDGYLNAPEVITVGGVNKNGRATYYSEPGSCLLVAAPGGGGDSLHGLATTDLVGPFRGANAGFFYAGDLADYVWGVQAFSGTSAAAPLVSGIAALMFSVNTNLNYRDVQHILALSAKQWDLNDPDLKTNGAGLRVSHNVGFGVPDSAHAVLLAKIWTNRPSLATLTFANNQPNAIPDAGLRVEVTGNSVPPALASVIAFPTFASADDPTSAYPLVEIGVATNVPAMNLTNKGALILRDGSPFSTKILNAAQAGAKFAIIYNSTNGGGITIVSKEMEKSEYAPIPAVFIGNSSGTGLKALFETNNSSLARIRQISADTVFRVGSTLLCEHVGVRVQTDYPIRGDLRITVRSPQGTRSVLQKVNNDTQPGPTDWTYWTTHHFLESSAGDWKISVTDQVSGGAGSIRAISLVIRGTEILDSDRDGLADQWEYARFYSLEFGPKDDPDGDGYSNAREHLMGTNPLVSDILKSPDFTRWSLFGSQMLRLSWLSAPAYNYQVQSGSNITSLNVITNMPGLFPETELFIPYPTTPAAYFKVGAFQAP